MAISRVLLSHLRRSRHLSSSLSAVSLSPRPVPTSDQPQRMCSPSPFSLPLSRFFSAGPDHDSELSRLGHESVTGLEGGGQLVFDEVSHEVIGAGAESSGFLAQHVISLLEWYHDVTGLPWWIAIISSTVAFRMSLVPVLILQLKQTKRISEFLPKLPPLWLARHSGRSVMDQLVLFRKERKAIGCPSLLWIPAYFSIQVSCFFLWITSIRRMSLDHHPGFDCGGALWFENLTEIPNGLFGPIFPFLIAGLHYTNTQITFAASSVQKFDRFEELAKYYKNFLNILTFVLYFLAYQMPQGSLVYWVTNLSFSVAQQSFLKHPVVRAKLGLPGKDTLGEETGNSGKTNTKDVNAMDPSSKGRMISVHTLTPQELVALSVKYLSEGRKERSIPLLRLALEKDPEYLKAMITMGQVLYQTNQFPEAAEYLERATSKLLAARSTEVEGVDLLIVASQWAGVANIRQGKTSEGIAHLERVANMNEPNDPKSKAHYFDALVLFSSALFNEGRKDEAAKYLRLVVAYDSSFKELLEQCEQDDAGLEHRNLDFNRKT